MANIDADDAKNKDIARKYDVSSYPTLRFFSMDNKDGIPYEGGRSEVDFINYLNEKCGTQRKIGGGLNDRVSMNISSLFFSLLISAVFPQGWASFIPR